MSPVFTSAWQFIGNTPLLELTHIEKEYNLKANILAKLEGMEPAGSAKDRVALAMLEKAESEGKLNEGATVIEPTSGNTGIALCALCAARGYRAVIVMPDTMSVERRLVMQAYGAEVVLTDGKLGMAGAIAKAKELSEKIDNSFIPSQFDNPANPAAHYKTTGPEILTALEGKVDLFVCGVGTGGTITGVGRYLKEHCPSVKIVAVEPATSAVLSGGAAGAHGIQGIGAGFVPSILDTEIYDEILTVTTNEAYKIGREMGTLEGLPVGISAGAALHAAFLLADRPENENKNIVVLLADSGERYLSTPMYQV